MKKILLIDNYDSFTYNLVHYLASLGAQVEVIRNDAKSAADMLAMKPDGIVISPGPATPNEAGICLELLARNQGKIPLFGASIHRPGLRRKRCAGSHRHAWQNQRHHPYRQGYF
jgi:anthranilate synthase component II